MEHHGHRHNFFCSGFTLIEMIMTIVIIGGTSLIVIPFFQAVSHSPDPLVRQRAVSLGQSMMDEILAKKWDENTPSGGGPLVTGETGYDSSSILCADGRIPCYRNSHPGYMTSAQVDASTLGDEGESRQNFNDVDDYNGIDVTDGNFTDQNGTAFTLANYQRSVAIRYIDSNLSSIDNSTAAAAGTTDSKLIVVTVTSSRGEVYYFTSVKCNL